MIVKLENCPCCNCEAELQMDDLGREYVECVACLLRTDAYRNDGYAAEIWNTRPEGWISVDSPPEDKGCCKILILDKGTIYTGYYSKSRGFEWWAGSFCNLDKQGSQKTITHYKLITLPEERS